MKSRTEIVRRVRQVVSGLVRHREAMARRVRLREATARRGVNKAVLEWLDAANASSREAERR